MKLSCWKGYVILPVRADHRQYAGLVFDMTASDGTQRKGQEISGEGFTGRH